MKMRKKFISLFILLGSVCLISGCASQEKTSLSIEKDHTIESNQTIAIVNDVEIKGDAFLIEMNYLEDFLIEQYGEDYKKNKEAMAMYDEQRNFALNYIIENELARQAAIAKNLTVSNEEVEKEYKQIQEDVGYEEEIFVKNLEEQGFSVESYKAFIHQSLLNNKLISEIVSSVTINEDEINDFYEQTKEEYLVEAGADVSHILVESKEKALEVKEKYNQGISFSDLAKEYSQDISSQTDGSLGYIPFNSPDYDETFMKAVSQLEENELSEPIETEFGWHIILVTNIQKESFIPTLTEIKDEVKQRALENKQFGTFNTFMAQLKQDSSIEILI